jgi:hypothetical protein
VGKTGFEPAICMSRTYFYSVRNFTLKFGVFSKLLVSIGVKTQNARSTDISKRSLLGALKAVVKLTGTDVMILKIFFISPKNVAKKWRHFFPFLFQKLDHNIGF